MQVAWQEVSRVAFRKLDPREMDEYLATRLWEGCSGAYAIHEQDDPYVRIVSGSMTNVIGSPMETLAERSPSFSIDDAGEPSRVSGRFLSVRIRE